jgi:signal transduction histidine kinase/ActR/RegA family two-component response regulator
MLKQRLQNYVSILGAVMALSMVVAVLMTSWMQAAMIKPILAMTQVARQVMARRDFSVRVKKTTEDEIGYLVDTFNDMLAEVGQRALALEKTNQTLEHEMAERRVAEGALRAADRRKDEFLATLAHELRNPLAPLRNALEILRTVAHDSSAADAARAMMERQLRQLVHLVNDLLDVSRITTGKMTLKQEQTQLQAIMQTALEATAPMIEARKQVLSVMLPSHPIYFHADPTRIAQAFQNLLHNAAKFTPIGGEIAVTAELQGADVTITVSDSGIGIPREMLGKIFDMFTQADTALDRSYPGLGVGLTLAKRLIELHGGSLGAESEGPGRGSRFIVRLPMLLVPDTDASRAIPEDRNDLLSTRQRLLVADDNEDFATSLAMILEAMGNEVKIAYDGLEALEIAQTFSPEVAFLDIGLPKINGYDLARRLRAAPNTRHTILVAVTGWGQESDKRQAKDAGFDHHLVKPVEPDQLQAVLLKARAGQDATA